MSVELDSKIIRITPRKFDEAIAVARNLMSVKVDEVLSHQVAIGNSEYTINVDGKVAYSRNAIYFARKNIRVNFAAGVAEVAVGSAVGVLKGMLMRWYPFVSARGSKNAFKQITSDYVSAWLNERGKASIPITSANTVSLNANQYITIAVRIPSGQINPIPLANFIVTQNTGKGFFERAARAVRRNLGVTRRTGTVRVAAIRLGSTKTIQPISDKKYAYKRPVKRHIPKTVATSTNWVIVIEPRRNTGQVLRG